MGHFSTFYFSYIKCGKIIIPKRQNKKKGMIKTMKKTIVCAALALVMLCACATPAFAAGIDTAGGTGTSPVTLTVTPAVFSVTVPTDLPVTMTADGAITVADSAKIVNNSVGAVKVTDVEITPATGWTLIDFDTDRSTLLVDEKKVGIELNGSKTGANGEYTFVAGDWDVMAATDGVDGGADEFEFTYDALLPIITETMDKTTIANVVFTIDWNK